MAIPRQPMHTPSPTARVDLERALWRALAAGDHDAAERLVEVTYQKIYGALFRLTGGDSDLAADLTQETYRKAWRSLHRFQGRSAFSTWLYRIAHNTFLTHIQRPRRLEPLDERQLEALPATDRSVQQQVERDERGERLRRAVLKLPEELQFAVTARYWNDIPVREIARLQGISPVGVRKRLLRANKSLARELGGAEKHS